MQQHTVAVIGCGYWGKNLVRNFHDLGALAVVCEPTPAGQQIAHALAPQVAVVTRVGPAPAPRGRGVCIAPPAETHYALVQQALAAGKDVLVEKPLALTYAQGAQLVHLAETYERILM